MPLLVPGRYRHYKGNLYQVLGLGTHSESLEKLVVYKALYGDGAVWIRPASMFFETVEHEGYEMPRFALEEETAALLDAPLP